MATASVEQPDAGQQRAAALRHVHQLVRLTHAENRADYRPLVAYRGWADRYRLPGSVWRAAYHWRAILAHAQKQPSLYVPPPVQATTIVASAGSSGGLWGCVAVAEESGHNSVAGFFGFIYPPSSYGFPELGPSWLAVGWAEQVAVAESLLARYGQGAWGPLTQEKCWGA